MCGIVGLVGAQEPGWIADMNAAQVHRGPDNAGVFHDPAHRVSLAMRRLSIIDLAGGHQPMSTGDGRFTIVFNGEIFNARELRADLLGRGASLRTDHSDTEVLLELFAREGVAALSKLNGMFAFAVFDRDAGRITLARDRLGIKPLYWSRAGSRFAFASELKSLCALPWLKRSVDRQSLFDYMSLMYVPRDRTIFEGVHRLGPGTWLELDLANLGTRIERWWTARPGVPAGAPGNVREALRIGLETAVDLWSVSDVPIACSLSGGLDSSSIVGLLSQRGHHVKTYSVGFTGAGEQDWNELPLAREVAARWGTDHHEIVLDPERLLDDLVRMVWHLDEPYGGGLPSWSVFEAMAGQVKVAMTGTGGDELFGNYGKWRALEGRPWLRWLKGDAEAERFQREFFERFYYFSDADKRRSGFMDKFSSCEPTEAWLFDEHFSRAESQDARDRVALTDIETQLPEEFLMMTDRFSMAHSIEARTPFLDHRFVETVLGLPASFRTRRGDLKWLLRSIVADLLPPPLLSAPKRGFVIPLKLWLRGRLRPVAEHLLSPCRLRDQGLFRPEFYNAYVLPHLNGTADNTQKVWAALMYQLWHLVFVESPNNGAPNFDLKSLGE
jgi:asparagine synthase (glutamine-hydrolysing)